MNKGQRKKKTPKTGQKRAKRGHTPPPAEKKRAKKGIPKKGSPKKGLGEPYFFGEGGGFSRAVFFWWVLFSEPCFLGLFFVVLASVGNLF